MKLIRWLLSNIILIAFILALTYAYVYWDNLTGPDTPAGKVIAVLEDEFESVRDFVESYQPDADESEQEVAAIQETVVAEQPSVASEPPRIEPVEPPPLPAQPPRQTAPSSSPLVSTVTPAGPASSATVATEHQLWIAARTAYQKGQYEKSIGLYREVVAANSDSFDAWGEMGNVYLRTGNVEQAGAAYYEAASIMVRLGQPARARSVLPLLHRLDRNRARQLNELLMKPGGQGGV